MSSPASTASLPSPLPAPLEGVRVLDLSRVIAGPTAAQLLGDFGAEVIKVERAGVGDDSRQMSVAWLPGTDGQPTSEGAFFLCANRAKKSLTVDLSKPQGQDLVRRLVERSDVLIENYKVGNLAQFGLDYESLSKVNPRLVYCSVTGYGQQGPYSGQPGYDPVFQAQCGLMSITGYPDDVPGGAPVKAGAHVIDIAGAHYAAMGIMAALRERDQHSGLGQHLDIALLDCGFSLMSNSMQHYLNSGQVPARYGNGAATGGPADIFECSDGRVYLLASTNKQVGELCRLLGLEDLTTEERFSTTHQRGIHRRALYALLSPRTHDWARADFLAALARINVTAGPVNDIAQALADPHVQQRGVEQPVPHPLSDKLHVIANPVRFSRTPVRYDRPPPLLGQHTDEVLTSVLGLDGAELDRLRNDRVI